MTGGFATMGISIICLDILSKEMPPLLFIMMTGVAVSVVVVPAGAGLYERMIAFLHIENATGINRLL
jgi:hypothetical protein